MKREYLVTFTTTVSVTAENDVEAEQTAIGLLRGKRPPESYRSSWGIDYHPSKTRVERKVR